MIISQMIALKLLAGASEVGAVVPSEVARKGAGVRKILYVVEIDGQKFEVSSIAEAESLLLQAKALATESAEKDVVTPVAPKPPRVNVQTVSGNKTTSKTLQQQIRTTQQTINRAYIKRAKEIAQDIEISQLMITKIKQEERDDESAIIALLLM